MCPSIPNGELTAGLTSELQLLPLSFSLLSAFGIMLLSLEPKPFLSFGNPLKCGSLSSLLSGNLSLLIGQQLFLGPDNEKKILIPTVRERVDITGKVRSRNCALCTSLINEYI